MLTRGLNCIAARPTFTIEWALTTPLDQILVHECFEAPTALENRFILGQMGPLRGKKILDIGAGLGESSVYFAMQGALVTGRAGHFSADGRVQP